MTQERKQFKRTEDGHLLLMSNEERNLLITDLTARINYGVICLIERVDDFGPIHRNEKLTGFCFDDMGGFHFEVDGGLEIVFVEKIMPYLRPMSSMTEEELNELLDNEDIDFDGKAELVKRAMLAYAEGDKLLSNALFSMQYAKTVDWLNKHHFDYRGLIEKGLALEAPEGMYTN